MTHEGVRGRRRSTFIATAIVLGVVALMLAITGYATGESKVLVVAIAVAVVAVLVGTMARRGPA